MVEQSVDRLILVEKTISGVTSMLDLQDPSNEIHPDYYASSVSDIVDLSNSLTKGQWDSGNVTCKMHFLHILIYLWRMPCRHLHSYSAQRKVRIRGTEEGWNPSWTFLTWDILHICRNNMLHSEIKKMVLETKYWKLYELMIWALLSLFCHLRRTWLESPFLALHCSMDVVQRSYRCMLLFLSLLDISDCLWVGWSAWLGAARFAPDRGASDARHSAKLDAPFLHSYNVRRNEKVFDLESGTHVYGHVHERKVPDLDGNDYQWWMVICVLYV